MNADPFKVKKHYRQSLLQLPNVVGVGVGPKMVAGKSTEAMAIKVYVNRKVPPENLKESEIIPQELDGIPTDVEEQAPMRAY